MTAAPMRCSRLAAAAASSARARRRRRRRRPRAALTSLGVHSRSRSMTHERPDDGPVGAADGDARVGVPDDHELTGRDDPVALLRRPAAGRQLVAGCDVSTPSRSSVTPPARAPRALAARRARRSKAAGHPLDGAGRGLHVLPVVEPTLAPLEPPPAAYGRSASALTRSGSPSGRMSGVAQPLTAPVGPSTRSEGLATAPSALAARSAMASWPTAVGWTASGHSSTHPERSSSRQTDARSTPPRARRPRWPPPASAPPEGGRDRAGACRAAALAALTQAERDRKQVALVGGGVEAGAADVVDARVQAREVVARPDPRQLVAQHLADHAPLRA